VRDAYLQQRAPDLCIIGEPSSWDHLTLGYKGSAWVEYTIRQSLTHTAAQSESACETAVRFWNTLQAKKDQFNTGKTRAFEQLTSSLRKMTSAEDGFYETAQLMFNLRLPPDLSVADTISLLEQSCPAGELRILDGIECFRGEKNSALVRAFLAAIRREGGKPGFLVKTGTSDMNLVGPAWKCPILAYGPGDSNLDHTPDEHISLTEYLTSVRILRDTLVTLCQESAA
jgi:LysW-gamma-L-lysine carboxypeptidase